MSSWATLVEIDWDSGTGYYSGDGVSTPTQFYEPRLLAVSELTRAVDVLPMQFQSSTCWITLADADHAIADNRGTNNWRSRAVRIKFGDVQAGTADLVTVFTGRILGWEIQSHRVTVTVEDVLSERLLNTIEGRVESANFVNLPEGTEPTLIPIGYGYLYGMAATTGGSIKPILIDPNIGVTGWRHLITRHACSSILYVYKAGVVLATPADYTSTTQAYGGYTCEVIDLVADPGSDQVTADVIATTETGSAAQQIEDFLTDWCGWVAGDLNTTKFTAAKAANDPHSFNCAYMIDQNMMVRQYLERWMQSSNISLWFDSGGDLAIKLLQTHTLIDETIVYALTDTDVSGLIISSNPRPATTIDYSFAYLWSQGIFPRTYRYHDPIAEVELGEEIIEPFDSYHYAGSGTAISAASFDRRYIMREDAYQVSFALPPEYGDLDLNDIVTLTHPEAPGVGGWTAQKLRVYEIKLDLSLRSPQLRIRAVSLPPSRPSDQCRCTAYCTAQLNDGAWTDGVEVTSWTKLWKYAALITNNPLTNVAGKCPLYRPTYGPLSLPCLVFDGVDNVLRTADNVNPDSAGCLFMIVFRCDAAAGDHILMGLCETGSAVFTKAIYTNGTTLHASVDGGANSASGTIVADTWYIAAMDYNSIRNPKTRLYINGTVQADTDNTAAAAATSVNFCVGGLYGGTAAAAARIAEVAVFEDVHYNDQYRRTYERVWADRYGITIA